MQIILLFFISYNFLTAYKPYPQLNGIDVNHPSIIPFEDKITDGQGIIISVIGQSTDTNRVSMADVAVIFRSKRFLIRVEPVGKFGDDMYYPVRKFKGVFRSDFLKAYTVYRFNQGIALILGRTPVRFGESPRYNLILDRWGVPLELAGISYQNPKVKFNAFISDLGQMVAKKTSFKGDTTKPELGSRFLSFHSIDVNIFGDLQVGFAEAIIWGGRDQGLNWYFVNPFLIYYANQFNLRHKNTNVMWLFHFKYTPPFKIGAYGEFLIDDYQYAKDESGEPNHTGLILGIEGNTESWGRPVYWLIEYTRVTRWVYNHMTPFTKWMRYGIPIGHPYGPDFEMYYGMLSIDLRSSTIALEFENLKKGQSSIKDYWPIPLSNPDQYRFPDDNFLSGDVKVSNSIGIRWGFKIWGFNLNTTVGVIIRVKPKTAKNGYYIGIGLGYKY